MKFSWIDLMIVAFVFIFIGFSSGMVVMQWQHEAEHVCVEKNKE